MTDQAEQRHFWEALGLPAPNSRISREAYDALPEVSFHMEYINGVVIYPNWNPHTMTPSPVMRHQKLVINLIMLLDELTTDGDLLTAPMDVQLGTKKVQPDVFWIAPGGACVPSADESYLIGAPDLIVEVLSSNTQYDRVTKYDLYEQHGVREYWIANPNEDYLEVYALANGKFGRVGAYTATDSFTSPVLGRTVTAAAIFR